MRLVGQAGLWLAVAGLLCGCMTDWRRQLMDPSGVPTLPPSDPIVAGSMPDPETTLAPARVWGASVNGADSVP